MASVTVSHPADDAYLTRYLSQEGIDAFGSHDAGAISDAKDYATSHLMTALITRYAWSTVLQSPFVKELWAVVALRTFCLRRGNPPPASLEHRYQEIMAEGGVLDQIRLGRLLLTDGAGNVLRPKASNAPAHANLIVDRRFPETTIRVVTGDSDMSPSKLPRHFDRYSEHTR